MTLEELLNSLIQRGWKPFGRETRHELSSWVVYDTIDFKWKGDIRVIDRRHHHIRELVAKESWLWQFVCENWMTNNVWNFVFRRLRDGKKFWLDKPITHYTFRVLESSLKDESELEQFLLSNIVIKDEE